MSRDLGFSERAFTCAERVSAGQGERLLPERERLAVLTFDRGAIGGANPPRDCAQAMLPVARGEHTPTHAEVWQDVHLRLMARESRRTGLAELAAGAGRAQSPGLSAAPGGAAPAEERGACITGGCTGGCTNGSPPCARTNHPVGYSGSCAGVRRSVRTESRSRGNEEGNADASEGTSRDGAYARCPVASASGDGGRAFEAVVRSGDHCVAQRPCSTSTRQRTNAR